METQILRPQKISLIIPIYNESGHLQSFLEDIDALEFSIAKELVFIDDHSKDRSLQILEGFSFKSEHQILRQEKNQGKGAALQRGINAATGDLICIQDADFEYSIDDLSQLIEPLLKNQADVVYGSRFKKTNNQVHRTFHYLVNRVLTMLSNIFSGLYLTDMETCYKIFRAELIKNIVLESNRFGFEPEVTAKIAKLKVRVFELPITYFPRNYLEGKKITWKDGLAALFHIVRFNSFRKVHQCTKPNMPQKYIPQSTQWL